MGGYSWDHNFPVYTPTETAARWFRHARELGFHVGIHVNTTGLDPTFKDLVKQFYPLRRQYAPGERVVNDYVPVGNIFSNAYYLREEKRKVWYAAKRITERYDKVIVLSDNTNSTPYSFFLASDGIELQETPGPEMRWAGAQKEFILTDVILEYDREALRQYLTASDYADFNVHFAPFIPERDPRLFEDVAALLAESGRELVK